MEVYQHTDEEESPLKHKSSDRKSDHIHLAIHSQTHGDEADKRFYYEPMVPRMETNNAAEIQFAGKKLKVPIWVSSMTGGNQLSGTINRNLVLACKEFGMGMGLGSCRTMLDKNGHFSDFNIRPIIGDETPLFANLGIAQIELMVKNNQTDALRRMVDQLKADGLIVHVNPLQEWIQPEGNKINTAPVETIEKLLRKVDFPIIVKEVGQGFGPVSIERLLELPLAAIEFGAFGGTNFAKVEIHRNEMLKKELYQPFVNIGVTAEEMVDLINEMVVKGKIFACKQLIISGGIRNYLDGYYLTEKSLLPAIYAQASQFLKHSRGDYSVLQQYVAAQIDGLQMARKYLTLRNSKESQ